MKAKTPSKRLAKVKPRSAKRKLRFAEEPTGCGYSLTWSLLASTKGFTQVWVPNKLYDKIATHFKKGAKSAYAKNLLAQRMAPLGVNSKCGGTCAGGWCEEHLIFDGGSSKVFVCECGYFT